MKHALTLLLLVALTTTPAPADSTSNAIIATAQTCLYDAGIRRIAIDVVRVDGNSAIVTYDIPDAGSATLYLAFDGTAWHCLGGTGGVPSNATFQRIAHDYAKFNITRSGTQLRDLSSGKRGKTLLKTSNPKTITLRKPHPH